jgi:hypothetical protein
MKPEGAMFCDGNYVDTGNNLANCVNAIKALFPNFMVTGYADANANCSGNTCTAQADAGASAKCSVTPGRKIEGAAGGVGILLALGAAFAGRRRRSSQSS